VHDPPADCQDSTRPVSGWIFFIISVRSARVSSLTGLTVLGLCLLEKPSADARPHGLTWHENSIEGSCTDGGIGIRYLANAIDLLTMFSAGKAHLVTTSPWSSCAHLLSRPHLLSTGRFKFFSAILVTTTTPTSSSSCRHRTSTTMASRASLLNLQSMLVQ
jgi:hypothetical protein